MGNQELTSCGRLGPPDLEKARRWYQQAAETGHTSAAALLES